MEWWMVGVLLLLFAGAAVVVVLLHRDNKKSSCKFEDFLLETERLADPPGNVVAIATYNKDRKQIFDRFESDLNLKEDKEDTPPEHSWLRKVPPDAKKHLKAELVKRAMANLERYHQLTVEVPRKYGLLQRSLITEKAWNKAKQDQEMLGAEINAIRKEAECIEATFGTANFVFKHAEFFLHVQEQKLKKAEMEAEQKERDAEIAKEKQREEEARKREETRKKVEEEVQRKKAEAAVQAMLREEEDAAKMSSASGPTTTAAGKKRK